ncbi:hypothetical protein GCM10025858_05100 [Alicyclobacillus sacchari]|nr:hypothetical protein GCM10025858_05100 [Alicyclobacillus sacchari]
MPFVITSPCIGEKAADCVETCPVDAIHEGPDQYYIDPDLCIDCAACERFVRLARFFKKISFQRMKKISSKRMQISSRSKRMEGAVDSQSRIGGFVFR